MKLTPRTRTQLEFGTRALTREFADVPPEVIERDVSGIAQPLIEHARFDDFVPVLVHRFVREHLLDRARTESLAHAA